MPRYKRLKKNFILSLLTLYLYRKERHLNTGKITGKHFPGKVLIYFVVDVPNEKEHGRIGEDTYSEIEKAVKNSGEKKTVA